MRPSAFSVLLVPPAPINDQTARIDNSYKALLTRSSDPAATRPAYVTSIGEGDWMYKQSATAWLFYYFDGTDDILLFTLNPTTNQVSYPTGAGTFGGSWGAEGTIASAATTDIGSINAFEVQVTGNVGITSFGAGADLQRLLRFTGTGLQITHHATQLILPAGKNIVTLPGDRALFESNAAGNWRLVDYYRDVAMPLPFREGEAVVASAATCDIGVERSHFINITGNVAITSFGTTNGGWQFKTLRFSGTPTLTHHATALILPTGANIVAAAGDTAQFLEDSSGNWRCLWYQRADGTPLAGGGGGTPADDSITNAKLANMVTDTVKGRRNNTSPGDPEDIPLYNLHGVNPRLINGTITATAASGALTFALKTSGGTDPSATDPVWAMFPNTTGGFTWVKIIAAVTLTIPSGQTMGLTASLATNIWCALFYDSTGPTVYFAAINCIDTSNNIFRIGSFPTAVTSAVSGASGTKTFYTSTALATAKPYIVVGYVHYATGLTTPGTWTTPSSIVLWAPGNPLPGDRLNKTGLISFSQQETTGTSYTPVSGTSFNVTLQSPANLVDLTMIGTVWCVIANVQGYVSLARSTTNIGSQMLGLSAANGLTVTCAAKAVDRPNSASAITYQAQFRNGGAGGTLRFPENSSGVVIEAYELQG